MSFHFNEDRLVELDNQYRIMRQESEKPFDYLVSDIIVKLIEQLQAERQKNEVTR